MADPYLVSGCHKLHPASYGSAVSLSDAKLAVITVLSSELQAVKCALGPTTTVTARLSGRVYYLATVKALTGAPHTIAILRAGNTGNQPAQLAVHQVQEDCIRIQHVIFCGIAGAAPNPANPRRHVRLGDLVVGTEGIFPYKDGKEHDAEFEVRGRLITPAIGDKLIAAAGRLQALEEAGGVRPWDAYIEELNSRLENSNRPDESDEVVEPSLVPILRTFRSFDRKVPHPYDEERVRLGTKLT
jgi:nucleoside phosphorylase